ncbi:hypothetical protein JNM87_02515 [Candidatus Saccharibacteria bacterium]|nr:hypothetical protein [Candidatus Saccharibacteria bacterium]
MKAFLFGLLFAVGVGTWVYTKLQQRTGYGNTGAVLKGTIMAAVIAFVVFFTLGLTFL